MVLRLLATTIGGDPRVFAALVDPWLRRLGAEPRARLATLVAGSAGVDADAIGIDGPIPAPAVAAALRVQLTRLDRTAQMRCNHGRAITRNLGNVGDLDPPRPVRLGDPAFTSLWLRVDDDLRAGVVSALRAAGVYAGPGPCRLLAPADAPTPVARELATELVQLPLHPHFHDADVRALIEQIRRALMAAIAG